MRVLFPRVFSDRAIGGLVFAVIFLGLVLAGLALAGLYSGAEIEYQLRWAHCVGLLSLLAAYTIALLSWHKQLQWLGVCASWQSSFIDIALLSIGKYLPGKVLGILVRGYRPESVGWSKTVTFQSFLDQAVLLSVGLVLAVLCWAFLNFGFSGQLLLVLLLMGLLLLLAGARIVGLLLARLIAPSRAIFVCVLSLSLPNRATFLIMMSGFCWLFTILAIFPFLDVNPLSAAGLHLGVAFLVSYLIGWLVVFIPAGAGIREGAFILLAAPVLDYNQAILAVLGYRLVGVSLDISLGLAGVFFRANSTR